MNPIAVATRSRNRKEFFKRVKDITSRYGVTPAKMDNALNHFNQIVQEYGCSATFPITAIALARNPHIIQQYTAQLEFAVHGYIHIDHSKLTLKEMDEHLGKALAAFAKSKVKPAGFRSPYLQWGPNTLAIIQKQGLVYDSSETIYWDVVNKNDFTPAQIAAYQEVLNLYQSRPAKEYLSLPQLTPAGLLRIPYTLPDDEAVVDRLQIKDQKVIAALWLDVLSRIHEKGELFLVGIHPERIFSCDEALTAILSKGKDMGDAVWRARLDEIAAWWLARKESSITFNPEADGKMGLSVTGPKNVTILSRALQVEGPTQPWHDGYQVIENSTFTIVSDKKPIIGLSPACPEQLASFLSQQGYLLALDAEPGEVTTFLDLPNFSAEADQRNVVAKIEQDSTPLLKLGRWPNKAKSVLGVTGDIDALTLWDYGLRFINR